MKRKGTEVVAPAPGRRGPMTVALAAILLLALVGWWTTRAGPAAGKAGKAPSQADFVLVDLLVDPNEWPARNPTLCTIANRYGLDSDALAATLHNYGGQGDCASPFTRVPRGRHVLIAVTARSPYPQCQRLARQPCPDP